MLGYSVLQTSASFISYFVINSLTAHVLSFGSVVQCNEKHLVKSTKFSSTCGVILSIMEPLYLLVIILFLCSGDWNKVKCIHQCPTLWYLERDGRE